MRRPIHARPLVPAASNAGASRRNSALPVLPVAVVLAFASLTGCSHSEGGAAAAPTAAPVASSEAAAPEGPASPAKVSEADYQQVLAAHACYRNSYDVAEDPLGRRVDCADVKAFYRLVKSKPAGAGDCGNNEILVIEQQINPDVTPPSLCVEQVTH
jgi:hypothetical protein